MDDCLIGTAGLLHGDLPEEVTRRLLAFAFDEAGGESLVGILRRLDARFSAGQSVRQESGRASPRGCRLVIRRHQACVRQAETFRAAPSHDGVAALLHTLEETRRCLEARRLLTSDVPAGA